jgi:hypothetical protein
VRGFGNGSRTSRPRLPGFAVSWAAMSAASADGLKRRVAALSVASPPPSTAGPRGVEVFAAGTPGQAVCRACSLPPGCADCIVQHIAWTKNEDDGAVVVHAHAGKISPRPISANSMTAECAAVR